MQFVNCQKSSYGAFSQLKGTHLLSLFKHAGDMKLQNLLTSEGKQHPDP